MIMEKDELLNRMPKSWHILRSIYLEGNKEDPSNKNLPSNNGVKDVVRDS